ncbi:MAG: GlsB/YeaQ/YmgE family stress response membrane protein [Flavobacteriales bacterium]|nr:GlsB/YeaQ/YmgE family stress response membrane protein [Flavobacteriales bacterium]
MSIFWFIIIGVVVGFWAEKMMKGGGFGLMSNLLLSVIGSVMGAWLFSLMGIDGIGGVAGSIVMAFVGAVLLLWIISKINNE